MIITEFSKQEVLNEIQGILGKRLDDNAFRRWRRAAEVPVKTFYNSSDIKAILFVGEWLQRDRSLERANKALKQELGQ